MENLLNLMEYAARNEDFELFMMAKNRLTKKFSDDLERKKNVINTRFYEIERQGTEPIQINIY